MAKSKQRRIVPPREPLVVTVWLLPALLMISTPAARADQSGDFIYTSDGTNVTITGYAGSSGLMTIPSSIAGLPVTTIQSWAFAGSKIITADIPDSVTSIGESAFIGCQQLTSIVIPNSVTNVGNEEFESCTSLTNAIIGSGLKVINWYMFHGCTSLISVTMPSGVTEIRNNAFQYCSSLIEVTIPNSVTVLGWYAFANCSKLTGVFFGGNVPNFLFSSTWFQGSTNATIYYLPGITGTTNFGGAPTAIWLPQMQMTDGYFVVQTNPFGFNITWASGQTVVVDACTDLAYPDWQPVQTNTLTTGSVFFSDPDWTNYPVRFYRLRSP